MKEKINCPVCRKRAFDICTSPKGEIWIELKCPHCRNIVQIRHKGFNSSERCKQVSIIK
nr:MAG TPA: cysteine-rich protein [Caudoviricetes sp.]